MAVHAPGGVPLFVPLTLSSQQMALPALSAPPFASSAMTAPRIRMPRPRAIPEQARHLPEQH